MAIFTFIEIMHTLRVSSTFRSAACSHMQVRGMASEKEVLKRIVSTKAIQKITKAMKMVAASKMRGDQRRLELGRNFGQSFSSAIFPPSTVQTNDKDTGIMDDAGSNHMLVIVTSDRGLCGAVNSSAVRLVKRIVAEADGKNKNIKLFIIGEKGRSQLRRVFENRFTNVIDEAYKFPVNFTLSSAIAQRILVEEFDTATIIFQAFKSAISYKTTTQPITYFGKEVEGDESASKLPEKLADYEVEPDGDEVINNLFEYGVAVSLYNAFLEHTTSEQSARMSAMDSASRNAGDMIDRLQLKYNRARQARITTELTEIISGASAL